MTRFAGIKNNSIYVVANEKFSDSELEVIKIPHELDRVPLKELLTHYKFRSGKIIPKNLDKCAKDLKVALVSNWKMRCGIATYSEFLYHELIKEVGDFKLFVEKNDIPTGPLNDIGGYHIPHDKIVACWERGKSNHDLIKEIKEYDPDVILIQHEFGLWPNACHWISLMNQLSDYRVIITMHSVFHHRDKTICEAAMPEIVVHLDGAKDLLKKEKGVPGNVHVVPHGCFPCESRERFWNFYKTNKTFMQFGFGFRYKGWEYCIRATHILKEQHPDVFFTGLFSESPFNQTEHEIYYNELMELVNKLGVQENVGIIRGYQSDASLDSYLRTNQVTVFPYISHPAHEVFGASGAARVAMSKGISVITTSVNHFSDLPSIKADSSEEIAAALNNLFLNQVAKEEQINKQINYLNDTTWKKVAKKYISIFENEIIDSSR